MSKIRRFFSMCGNYSVVSTPRVMFAIHVKRKENNPKAKAHCFRITFLEIKAFTFPIFEFSDFFMFFMFFDVPARFQEAPSHLKSCFFLFPRSGKPSRMIPDRFGKLHFLWKFLKKWSVKVRPSFQKTHMYIQPNPDLRPDSESSNDFPWLFLISLNSNDRILRKSQNKIEKWVFGDAEY